MKEFLAKGQQVLTAQPFSQLLGAELTEFSVERVEMAFRSRNKQNSKTVMFTAA